ncbi:MAG: NADPH:quinone oxidoreductase family protein [Terriglobales bacterium]|jgi:NADPH2:quinone reductase
MKAIVAARLGGPEVLEYQDVTPPQLKDDEVLVKVEAAGVNFADLLSLKGAYAGGPQPPFVPGREFAGTVVGTGERVMGYAEYGAFAEQIAAPGDRLWPAPPNFTAAQAASFPVNFFTAYFAYWEAGLVEREPDHNLRFPGERRPRVLIHAVAGGVGTAAIQMGKLLGVEMYGTASSDGKIEGAVALGLDHGIVTTRQDYQTYVREHTHGEGVDAVFEMIGGDETARSIRTMGFLGRCILYGAASGKPAKFDPRELYAKAQSVWGLWLSRMASRREVMSKAAVFVNRGVAEGKLRPVIGQTLPLARAAEGFRLLADRKNFGKVVLEVSSQ